MGTNIVGLDLNIDKDYLAQAVQQTVMMGIAESLNGKNEIVSQLVNSVLQTKVDKNGNISSYSSDNKYTLLEYYIKSLLTDVAKQELKNMVEEKRADVSAMIRKELNKKGVADKFVQSFINNVSGSLDQSWKTTVNVEINPFKAEY